MVLAVALNLDSWHKVGLHLATERQSAQKIFKC